MIISENNRTVLWNLYCSAYRRAMSADGVSLFLARESINAVLQYDNYCMAVNLADHAEDICDIWHDYNWFLQEEYYKHIGNVI